LNFELIISEKAKYAGRDYESILNDDLE